MIGFAIPVDLKEALDELRWERRTSISELIREGIRLLLREIKAGRR
jgi:Arc/MetJ-type ribon-helix-helix transcriptional regulator